MSMQRFLTDRKIDTLFHFTRAENLPNILEHGLLPRSVLEENNIDSSFNDEYRYDKCKNAVCTSIEFPNYKMFYTLRMDNPDVGWVVLLLNAQIMCDFECVFCSTNAGNARIYTRDIEERKGVKALRKLFDERDNGPTRKELGIPDWYPTDPQSEVLVFANIPTSYINKVFFENKKVFEKYTGLLPRSILGELEVAVFEGRKDWNYWR